MTEAIATDKPLSATQRAIFDIVLDLIIPADPQRGKPSAADVGVFDYIFERDPSSLGGIANQLDELETAAIAEFKESFATLTRESQEKIVHHKRTENPQFLVALAVHTTTCYYLDAKVMAAIGLPPRAPYPEGFTVPRGDLGLLDPVRERHAMWRRAEIEQIKQNDAQ